jgi:hypothetical protein
LHYDASPTGTQQIEDVQGSIQKLTDKIESLAVNVTTMRTKMDLGFSKVYEKLDFQDEHLSRQDRQLADQSSHLMRVQDNIMSMQNDLGVAKGML